MLKIRDDVDLKELEKFGFEYEKTYKNYRKIYVGEASKKDINLYYHQYKNSLLDNYFCAGINIFIDKEQIFVQIEIYGYYDIQVDFQSCDVEYYIQDLLDAGLIEKVVEK